MCTYSVHVGSELFERLYKYFFRFFAEVYCQPMGDFNVVAFLPGGFLTEDDPLPDRELVVASTRVGHAFK